MVNRGFQALRGIFVALAVLALAFGVHVQVGGEVHPSPGGGLLVVLVLAASFFFSKDQWTFFQLLLAMMVAQLGFHFAFSGSMEMAAPGGGHSMAMHDSSVMQPMLMVHVLAAIVCAAMLARADQKLFELLRSTFEHFVQPIEVVCLIASSLSPVLVLAQTDLQSQYERRLLPVRGPPTV